MLSTPRPPRLATLAPAVVVVTTLLMATAWGADNLIDDLRLDTTRLEGVAERASEPDFEVLINDVVLDTLDHYVGREAGRRFLRRGLVRSEEYDELVTEAAMRLLGDLYDEFGDWGLALAGYNQGAKRVRKAIAQEGTADI